VKPEIHFSTRRPKAGTLYFASIETDRPNVIGPAGGFRAQNDFPYSSQPARSSRET
jgi:hypothetical protein